MTGYEKDFIYKVIPKLTNSIDKLANVIQQKDNTFYKALDDAGITAKDFADYIGCIFAKNVANNPSDDDALIKKSWDFIQKVYEIASDNK